MFKIQETYKDFVPPKCVMKSAHRLVRHTPKRYLAGLGCIHLTNSKAFNRKLRQKKTKSRKRKVALNHCLGWYVQQWNNEPARIELVIDVIYDDYPSWAEKIGFLSDVMLSKTFYHELGHHIHKTQSPEYTEKENVADKWCRRLSHQYFWSRYWHIMVIIWPVKGILNWILKRHDPDGSESSAF